MSHFDKKIFTITFRCPFTKVLKCSFLTSSALLLFLKSCSCFILNSIHSSWTHSPAGTCLVIDLTV